MTFTFAEESPTVQLRNQIIEWFKSRSEIEMMATGAGAASGGAFSFIGSDSKSIQISYLDPEMPPVTYRSFFRKKLRPAPKMRLVYIFLDCHVTKATLTHWQVEIQGEVYREFATMLIRQMLDDLALTDSVDVTFKVHKWPQAISFYS